MFRLNQILTPLSWLHTGKAPGRFLQAQFAGRVLFNASFAFEPVCLCGDYYIFPQF